MKRKLALAGTILFVVFVIIAILGIAVWVDSLPVSQPKQANIDLRAVMPTRAEIPAESNGFALMIQAGKSMQISGNEPIFANYTNWDEAEAQDIVAGNQKALSTLREALVLPYLEVDAVTNADQEFAYLRDWKGLSQLAIVAARLSFEHGQEWSGYTQAMEVVRLGQRIQQAEGDQTHYAVGRAIKSMGLTCIRQLTDTTSLSPSNLICVSQQLTNFDANQVALKETLKVEYTLRAMNLDGFSSMVATSTPHGYGAKFVYDVDRSKKELAAEILSTIEGLTNPYASGVAYLPVEDTNTSFSSLFTRALRGNMIGTILNEMSLDFCDKMLAAKCKENVTVRATRVILALKAFQMVNHRLPNSLQELVPDFLDAVPLDDFHGKPLRYNPNLKEVYSVGTDLKDAGGIKSTNSTNIIFPFKF